MSKSSNMLRTRRKDVNIKPNRRLDRKSSRGMIYENEELRLRTININAEIERGQSDIKKLRRENELLRKEIWCLRDEYEKLDKLLKEKDNDNSCTSSTGSSDTESCSSCSESEENEASQNLENVQKTNLKNLHLEFDHLSVVPEENSTENSERNSNRTSAGNENVPWNFDAQLDNDDEDVIKPDQSYPKNYGTVLQNGGGGNIPQQHQILPGHFFSQTKISKSYEDYVNNKCGKPGPLIFPLPLEQQPSPLESMGNKAGTDVLVKTDNQTFNNSPSGCNNSRSSFSNGGNLEELLNDIETISNDILDLSVSQNTIGSIGPNFELPENYETVPPASPKNLECPADKPYKSELNVVLMPTPMPIIGLEKYKNLQNSLDSINSKSLEKLSVSYENLRILPDNIGPDNYYNGMKNNVVANCDGSAANVGHQRHLLHQQHQQLLDKTNPFYFAPLAKEDANKCMSKNAARDTGIGFKKEILEHVQNSHPSDGNNHQHQHHHQQHGHVPMSSLLDNSAPLYSSKSNLIDSQQPENVSSENEEILKFKTSDNKSNSNLLLADKTSNCDSDQNNQQQLLLQPPTSPIVNSSNNKNGAAAPSSPKSRKTRKVSIYFKGKKDKKQRSLSLDTAAAKMNLNAVTAAPAPRKHSFLDTFKLATSSSSESKRKVIKTSSSTESRHSNCDTNATSSDSKTPASATSADSVKAPNFDAKNAQAPSDPSKPIATSVQPTSSEVPKTPTADRKQRKSQSISPERKHSHRSDVMDGGNAKKHKKHHKKDRSKPRRSTASTDRQHRDRSFSVCTNRSNNLFDSSGRMRYGGFYDDNSDRERSNSMSSCDSLKERKLSNLSNAVYHSGKIPWCGCWGNGCL